MGHRASRRGAVDFSMPLMILTIVAMLGFMYWLYLQGQDMAAERAAAAEQAAQDSIKAEMLGEIIPGDALQVDPGVYQGKVITVEGLMVASMLGTQGFWLELPNKNPFLVSLSDNARAQGIPLNAGQTINVSGTIHPMGDSVLTAWSTAGRIGEGDRLAAEFATHFLEAQSIEVPAAATPGAAPSTGGEG